jgi:hypothetical protein
MRIANTTISVEEYLSSVYEPECDYVDGQLEDRNAGDTDYSTSNLPTSESGLAHSIGSAGGGGVPPRTRRMGVRTSGCLIRGAASCIGMKVGPCSKSNDALATTDPGVTIQLLEIWQ